MAFLSKLLGGTVNAATFVIQDIAAHAEIRKIRAEHDKWMREVQYGVSYFTVDPTIPARDDMSWTRGTHNEYVFDGRRGQWPHNYQLLATNGSLSWQIWFEHGPLTTEWKPTMAHYALQDALEEPGRIAAMQAKLLGQISPAARATHERAMADIRRRYPESAKLLTAR